MANTQAYFGFTQYQGGAGGAPTFAQSVRRIASSSGAIYTGDPVMPAVSSANGYIVQASPGSTTLAGIFVGCRYLNTSLGRVVWSPYWPGSGATGDVEAYVIDDPASRFIVQTSTTSFPITGTLATQTSGVQGQYAQFSIGSGNTSTGRSGAYLSSLATTATFPFVVIDYQVGFQNGGDPTSQYCNVIVGFNNEWLRSNGAGPTGIS